MEKEMEKEKNTTKKVIYYLMVLIFVATKEKEKGVLGGVGVWVDYLLSKGLGGIGYDKNGNIMCELTNGTGYYVLYDFGSDSILMEGEYTWRMEW